MGSLVWHDLSRIIAIAASTYAVWAAFWGVLFRKFFWDFIGGVLRSPGGMQPSPKVYLFTALIVQTPVVQVVTIILGFFLVALEHPLHFVRESSLYRSIPLRIVLLVLQAFFAALFYQGTNASLWSLIAAAFYTRAFSLGERIECPKADIEGYCTC